jgi:glucose dehydrogenase
MRFKAGHLSAVALAVVTIGATVVAQDVGGITSADVATGLKNPARWLSYSGDYTSQRYSPLTEITAANAGQLSAQWSFQTGVVGKFEATPIVIDGTLYVTGALDHAWAIDGKTGAQLWHYQRFPGSAPPQGRFAADW